jgi:hypothetical protein
MRLKIPVGYGGVVEPGADRLPEWIMALASLLLFGLILLGGLWLRQMEIKARALEKQRLAAGAEDEKDA